MNCPEAQAWLQRRLDGEAADGAGLEAHLAACPACREAHAAAQVLLDGLRRRVVPVPPADLAQRIVSAALVDRARRQTRRRLLYGAGLTAAGLAAAVLLAVWMAPPRTPPAGGGADTVAAETAPPRKGMSSPREQVSAAGLAVASLTRKAADETAVTTRLLLPDVALPPAREPDPQAPAPVDSARSLAEVKQGVSAGLEPVTTSARRAFSLFLRELPGGGETKTGL
jgi:predicted anti-sigma-YlaC factor YlaD